MKPANTTFRRREGCVPNPKLRLQDQLHEVMWFKQFSLRTEEALRLRVRVNRFAA